MEEWEGGREMGGEEVASRNEREQQIVGMEVMALPLNTTFNY